MILAELFKLTHPRAHGRLLAGKVCAMGLFVSGALALGFVVS